MKKTVIIIEDNLLLLEAYQHYFNFFDDYILKGVYTTIEASLSAYKNIYPDIILSDISMPGMGGLEGIKEFKKLDNNVKIIIITIHDDLSHILESIKNHADGYLTKPINKSDIKNALDSLKFGGAPLSDNVSRKLIETFQNKELKLFSKRENEITKLLMKGYTYRGIADKIFVSHSTVNYHVQNIYVKLDVKSKSDALKKLNDLFSAKKK